MPEYKIVFRVEAEDEARAIQKFLHTDREVINDSVIVEQD